MSAITTHILDTSLGRPAAGVRVELHFALSAGEWTRVGAGTTNDDGRARDLMGAAPLAAGTWRLTFHVAEYFARSGRTAFYPEVQVTFAVADAAQHYHVPLLLNPFGYSTYRGS